ncbi:hypothetical protein BaRGS_00021730 [Batillaria attramentaria]|uniref:Uncharacterized protein n=1 Tax=Batillaria attramentaria TaxID=370345 RepID=A0ABD0KJX2_9CAEN
MSGKVLMRMGVPKFKFHPGERESSAAFDLTSANVSPSPMSGSGTARSPSTIKMLEKVPNLTPGAAAPPQPP